MSRIAKQPVEIPSNVEVNINGNVISFKGPKGEASLDVHTDVSVNKDEKSINVEKPVFGQGEKKLNPWGFELREPLCLKDTPQCPPLPLP